MPPALPKLFARTSRASTWCALALAAPLAACGGGDASEFVGVYQVDSHTYAAMQGGDVACADTGEAVTTGRPYLQLAVDPFFDELDLLRLSQCSDAVATDCVEELVLFSPGGPGLSDESANSQVGGGFACQLYYSLSEAALAGTTLTVTLLDKYDMPALSESECSLEAAEALADSPTCLNVERWQATRVP